LTGCASIGPPLPPSLELPRPPADLHAARKGDRVTLTWTIPERTTDRQRVRYLGKTRICRGLDGGAGVAPTLRQCETAVGEAAPPAGFGSRQESGARKETARFVDTLASAMEQEHAAGFAWYAIEVLNEAGRGAGISNQVRVALVPTLAPFASFAARATGQGVLISWQCPAGSGGGRGDTKYLFRIYRRGEGGGGASKIADVDATECAAGERAPAPGLVPEKVAATFLDQTFEWEKTYFYRGAVVSVLEVAGKPAIEVEGEDTPEVKVFAHDVFPPAVPAGVRRCFRVRGSRRSSI